MIVSLSKTLKRRFTAPVILVVALLLIFIHPADPRENSPNLVNTAARNIVPAETTDPDLVIYKKVSDSLEKITRWKKQRLTPLGSGVQILFAGITRIEECDTCLDANEKSKRSKYFISFNGFALKPDAGFRVEGNDYFIERYIVDERTASGSVGHTEEEKIGVRLSDPGHGRKGLNLLVPVSPSFYSIIEIIMYILFAIVAFMALWLFVKLPAIVLINIANGYAFVPHNIKNLKRIGWGIIVICLVMVIMPWLMQLILSSRIPGEIYYPFWSSLLDYRWEIFLGFGVLMLARAFKQGHQLQQEQDLTI
ncbi:MAG TPA: DUF2975 domain-containing protein [Chitinophagaceae bacterium]|jgi:hypothetical protein|nr:DUF2975 domain-containing protein [Chitinophagaceae bacterium]